MFWEVFIRLCQMNNVSPNAVAKECGVKSTGTVTAWKKGAMPRDGVLAAMADYFGVDVDFLSGNSADGYLFGTEHALHQAQRAYDAETDEQRKFELACEIDTLRESIADQQFANAIKKAPTVSDGREEVSAEGHHIGVLFDRADEKDKLLTHSVLDKYDEIGAITTIPTKSRNPGGLTEIDVYDEPAAAGVGNYLDSPQKHREQFPAVIVPKGTDFGVRISGDSMSPLIEDGVTVFIKQTMRVESKSIGIFILNGEAYCKQLIVDKQNKQVRLHSLNPDYDDIIVTASDNLVTIGQVL